ncbi:hypothetical protein [Clostridium sp. JN-1]|uniref:DUF6115 domain-containing protein n=1 Tax=Clostridium sp. JN-1 TaxID=2483110 RepID=UPI001FA98EF4|nr:hypothetical protein [Clostridium sp. JN-1]
MNAVILIIIGSLLIVLNVRAINNQKKSFDGILNNRQDNVKDYEIEITKLREEFSNTILELQKEIEQLKIKLKENKDENHKNIDCNIHKEDSVSSNGVKVNEIKRLLNSGMSIDSICQELDMGKGEVLLVKELYAK